jgi:quercetin dioxygenase-like cupin family protein
MTTRKQFFKKGAIIMAPFLLPQPLQANENTYSNPDFEGLVVNEEEGEAYQLKGGTSIAKIKVAKSQGATSVCLLSEVFPPGQAILIHKHLFEDEFIILHRGTGLLTLGEKEYQIKEGATVFIPKGVWHGLINNGTENIDMRFGYSPAGFEGFFREVGVPVGQPYVQKPQAERRAAAVKFGFVQKEQK